MFGQAHCEHGGDGGSPHSVIGVSVSPGTLADVWQEVSYGVNAHRAIFEAAWDTQSVKSSHVHMKWHSIDGCMHACRTLSCIVQAGPWPAVCLSMRDRICHKKHRTPPGGRPSLCRLTHSTVLERACLGVCQWVEAASTISQMITAVMMAEIAGCICMHAHDHENADAVCHHEHA